MIKKLLCHFDTVKTVFFDTVYHFSTHSFQNDYFHTKFIIFFEIFVQQKNIYPQNIIFIKIFYTYTSIYYNELYYFIKILIKFFADL